MYRIKVILAVVNPLIAGIDPGTTIGIALLDLEGRLILTAKKKNFSRSKIIKLIVGIGNPVVISGDVFPPSRMIEKIAAAFSARIITPKESMRRKDKVRSTKNFLSGSKRISRHERDALAAAIYGWRRVRPLINKVNERLRRNAGSELASFVKSNVILNRDNITESIKQFNQIYTNHSEY